MILPSQPAHTVLVQCTRLGEHPGDQTARRTPCPELRSSVLPLKIPRSSVHRQSQVAQRLQCKTIREPTPTKRFLRINERTRSLHATSLPSFPAPIFALSLTKNASHPTPPSFSIHPHLLSLPPFPPSGTTRFPRSGVPRRASSTRIRAPLRAS